MDPLSNALSLLRPKSAISARLNAGGDWAITFPAHEGVKFNAAIRGNCWLKVEGDQARHVEAGDCVLFTQGRPFVAASNLDLVPVDASAVYDHAVGGVATCNGGGDFSMIGGRFLFGEDGFDQLFGALPAVVYVRNATAQAQVLRWSLDQLVAELDRPSPGGSLMAEHLAQMMLLQVLRLWLGSDLNERSGWLGALADPRLGRVISGIHAEPARRWTLADLAALANMSRTTFAVRFRQVVGQPPLDYLKSWRMQLAADQLQHTDASVASIGHSVGYQSEAAFSTAFRRMAGCSPLQFKRTRLARPAPPSVMRWPGRTSDARRD